MATPSDALATHGQFIARNPAELRALQITPRLLSSRSLLLDLPGLSPDVASAASERIARHAGACGCGWGAVFMAIAVVPALGYFAFAHGVWTAAFLWRLPLVMAIGLAATGAGKWFGLKRAHAKLKHEIEQVLASQSIIAGED
jgi:hypothetical protein